MIKLYLAQPYTHQYGDCREWRFTQACKASAVLYNAGLDVRSPIAHCHPIAKYLNNHNSRDFWLRITYRWLDDCDGIGILMLPGWEYSVGIDKEVLHAANKGKFIVAFDATTLIEKEDYRGAVRAVEDRHLADSVRRGFAPLPEILRPAGEGSASNQDNPEESKEIPRQEEG